MCTQAYIPKRGLFYEHDDRLESGEEEEGDEDEEGKPKQEKSGDKSESGKPATDGSAEKAGLKPKRVFRSDAAEKWGHDKFSEYDQSTVTTSGTKTTRRGLAGEGGMAAARTSTRETGKTRQPISRRQPDLKEPDPE